MSRVQFTPEQLKRLGKVEKDGTYVDVKSLSPTGKVDKIEPSVTTFQQKEIERVNNRGIQFGNKTTIGLTTKVVEAIEAEEKMKLFKEQGILTVSNTKKYFGLPNGESIEIKYEFNLSPCPAPRMTQSDKWKTDPYHSDPNKRQRKPVVQYFAFKNRLLSLCEENGYKLTKTLNILFIIPFHKSYSKKKCEQLNNQPHDQKPDVDNLSKCWMDSLSTNDCQVWNIHAIKLWGYEGKIIIF